MLPKVDGSNMLFVVSLIRFRTSRRMSYDRELGGVDFESGIPARPPGDGQCCAVIITINKWRFIYSAYKVGAESALQ